MKYQIKPFTMLAVLLRSV